MLNKLSLTFLSFLLLAITNLQSYEKDPNYKYQLAAVLMFQDEAPYLKEWIEYHKLLGVDHFYLYNNGSTDNYKKVLKPYIASGEVQLFHYPEITKNQADSIRIQTNIYMHAVNLSRGQAKWLAAIDADEFIVPVNQEKITNSILEVLKDYEDFGGLYLNWLCFGTSNVQKIPEDKLSIEVLTYCNDSYHVQGKCIARPERVSNCTNPHYMHYHAPFYHVNTNYVPCGDTAPVANDKMVIFHYITRDIDHLKTVKYPRRLKWMPALDLEDFVRNYNAYNKVYNPFMMKYVPALRKKMGYTD